MCRWLLMLSLPPFYSLIYFARNWLQEGKGRNIAYLRRVQVALGDRDISKQKASLFMCMPACAMLPACGIDGNIHVRGDGDRR